MNSFKRGNFAMGLICLGLAACGGGGGNGGATGVSATEQPGRGGARSPGMLKSVSSEQEMRDSLTLGLSGAAFRRDAVDFAEDGGDLVTSPSPAASADYSTTTLQEQGVDEADVVKYDGNVIYALQYGGMNAVPELAASSGISLDEAAGGPLIRLYRTDPATPATEEVASISLEDYGYGGGLYLYEGGASKHLLMVGQSGLPWSWDSFSFDSYWRNHTTRVQAFSVDNPESPATAWSLDVQGALLTSRRVDNLLYLVTRYSPSIDGVDPYPATDDSVAANRALIEATPLADLMPDMVRDDGAPQELLAAGDCLVPNKNYDGQLLPPEGGSLITVTAIDLQAPDRVTSLCINSFATGFYASRESLYITAGSADNHTVIHKVSLADGQPEYRGSGAVRGHLGTGNPSFLMSEVNGDLRIASSEWDFVFFDLPVMVVVDEQEPIPEQAVESEPETDLGRHFISVLRESAEAEQLEQVAQIPNRERPRKIGKPGEDLYAARFLGDRAYLVTFEVIDPLYVIDLSDPEDPRVAGELEVPGFSTYLQPLGESVVLGIGSDVPAQGPALTGGVKLSLFDVADITAPAELASAVIGQRGSHSAAQHNHHALSLLRVEDNYRVALPIQRHDILAAGQDPADPWAWYDWSDSGLYQFEVDPVAGSLTHVGTLVSEQSSQSQPWPLLELYQSRSVLHNDAVFFVQPPNVISALWGK